MNEFKVSPDRVFPVREIGSMEDSLKRIGEKAGCSVRVSPHVARHFQSSFFLKMCNLQEIVF